MRSTYRRAESCVASATSLKKIIISTLKFYPSDTDIYRDTLCISNVYMRLRWRQLYELKMILRRVA